MTKKILLGLTTTPGSDWKEKIKEIEKFQISEIALFATGINIESRKELYDLLEKSYVKNIPHVHLRDDMESWEVDYLISNFHTEVFNIHNARDVHNFHDFQEKLGKYAPVTYLENTRNIPTENELSKVGGLCIDFSHWQDGIMFNIKEYYNHKMEEIISKFSVGCSHISAVGKKVIKNYDVSKPEVIYENYSKHFFDELSEFDYIKNFVKYIPAFASLELENSFEEQLKAKDYLEKIIYE